MSMIQVSLHCMALESGHQGVQLLMQWDDLLLQQLWGGLLAWPRPQPSTLLTFREKVRL
jgi:hypothetical protein